MNNARIYFDASEKYTSNNVFVVIKDLDSIDFSDFGLHTEITVESFIGEDDNYMTIARLCKKLSKYDKFSVKAEYIVQSLFEDIETFEEKDKIADTIYAFSDNCYTIVKAMEESLEHLDKVTAFEFDRNCRKYSDNYDYDAYTQKIDSIYSELDKIKKVLSEISDIAYQFYCELDKYLEKES